MYSRWNPGVHENYFKAKANRRQIKADALGKEWETADALLADEPNNDVAGVDVPDALQATIISTDDYRKAQQSDEEVCDVKNKLELLSSRGVLRPKKHRHRRRRFVLTSFR